MTTFPKNLHKIELPKNDRRPNLSWALIKDGFIYKTDAKSIVRLSLLDFGFSPEDTITLNNTLWPLEAVAAFSNKPVKVLPDGRIATTKGTRVCYHPSRFLNGRMVEVFDFVTGERNKNEDFNLPDFIAVWTDTWIKPNTKEETHCLNLESILMVKDALPTNDQVWVAFNSSCMKFKPAIEGKPLESAGIVMLSGFFKDGNKRNFIKHPKF